MRWRWRCLDLKVFRGRRGKKAHTTVENQLKEIAGRPQGTKKPFSVQGIDTFAGKTRYIFLGFVHFLHIDKRGLAFIIYAIWRSLRQANKFCSGRPMWPRRPQRQPKDTRTRCKREIQNAARGQAAIKASVGVFCMVRGWGWGGNREGIRRGSGGIP